MERKIKYSVVIPLYNKESYIRKTIHSVLKQTYQDYEIIVVDDGSKDNSYQEASKIKDSRVRIVKQENQGVAVARNTGIYEAQGEYIAFLDADDYWEKNYLETIDHLVENYAQSDIFVTAYRVIMGKGKVNKSKQRVPEEGCLDSYWETLGGGYDFVWTSATTIRKSTLLAAGCFTPGEKVGQDLDMWARVARINPRVAYSSKLCVRYNRIADQNTRNRIKVAYAAAFIRDLEEELENDKHTEKELEAIQNKYDLKMTVYVFTAILAGEKKRARKELKRWKSGKSKRAGLLKAGLTIALFVPTIVNRWLYQIRLRVF